MNLDANSRHLRLARRALKAARTHLRNAANRTSMPVASTESTEALAIELGRPIEATRRLEREANAHLEAKVRARKAAK